MRQKYVEYYTAGYIEWSKGRTWNCASSYWYKRTSWTSWTSRITGTKRNERTQRKTSVHGSMSGSSSIPWIIINTMDQWIIINTIIDYITSVHSFICQVLVVLLESMGNLAYQDNLVTPGLLGNHPQDLTECPECQDWMRNLGSPDKWDSCLEPWVLLVQEGLLACKDNQVLPAQQVLQANMGTPDQWDLLVPGAPKALQENLVKMVNLADQDRREKLGFQDPLYVHYHLYALNFFAIGRASGY
uniref:Uncharacterized protein n=1 Tax=Sphaerodactylus townsendi TaxID=933632 RepID=A0ACB8G032_9SAUR